MTMVLCGRSSSATLISELSVLLPALSQLPGNSAVFLVLGFFSHVMGCTQGCVSSFFRAGYTSFFFSSCLYLWEQAVV